MTNCGLMGRWRLDEGSGLSIADTSGNGKNAQLSSLNPNEDLSGAWCPGAGPFPGTAALRFTGTQFVAVNDTDVSALEPCVVSVEARVNARSNPGAVQYVLSKGAEACSFASYAFYTGRVATDGLSFYVAAPFGDVNSPRVPPEKIWDGRWHHVLGTFDGRIARLYFDGVEQHPATALSSGSFIGYSQATNNRFYIGMYRYKHDDADTCNYGISAMISDVLLWRGVLSSAEVSARCANADLA